MTRMTKEKKLHIIQWFAVIAFIYFVFSGIMNYMMASGVEIYIIKYDVKEHRLIFEHIVDDGMKGDENIHEEIEKND